MVEAATIGASTTHGYMQTRDNMQQGVDGGGCKPNLPFILGCLTGVTDSSNRDDEEKSTSTSERLRRLKYTPRRVPSNICRVCQNSEALL